MNKAPLNKNLPPNPAFPEPNSNIRIVVDLNRCQGYAQCCFLAPKVFELHGEEALWYDPAPDSFERERVLRAAAACPVQAITVEVVQSKIPLTLAAGKK